MLPSNLAKHIDDLMQSDLLYWRDLWFGWLLLCAKIVAIGLLLEGPELLYEMESIARSRLSVLKSRKILPKRFLDLAKVVAFLGWILIAVGVAGEWVTEAMVSDADNSIRTFTSIQVTEARKEAALAMERSAGAYERAEGFRFQIAQANQRAAEANRTAESERLARVQLQKELQPRRLTNAQKEKLTSLLRDKPNPIFILTMGDDTETADLANDIGDALNKAGWKTFFTARFSFEHGIEVGTSRESDMSALMPAIKEVEDALSAVGLSSRTTLFDPKDTHLAGRFEKNVLCLVIDHKPVIKAPE